MDSDQGQLGSEWVQALIRPTACMFKPTYDKSLTKIHQLYSVKGARILI
jgi:hypothetical protein